MKRYHTYKDSGVEWIGKVPEGWSVLRLKWVCNFLYGESLSAQEREDGTIPVYGSNGIVGYHNRSITEKPCIIVGRKGSFGKVTFSEKKCYPIDTTYYIDCTSTKNYMRWLWYLLPLLKMDEFSRDSAVPGLNREDAYRNIVTLPSSYEQKQIATYLDRKTTQIDNLISKKQKLIELLKEERAATINQAVTKGLNLDVPMKDSGIEWLGEIPVHWEVLRLKWVCNFLYGESLSAQEREDGTIPVYGSNGIIGYHNRAITEKPCIIVGRKGSFGKVSFSEKKCFPIDTTYYIDCTSTNSYLPWLTYLLPLLKMDEFSRDSAVPGLNREDAYGNFVPLPSLFEQKQITTNLDEKTSKIDQTISKIKKQIELLQEYRTALISEVVTGKIDVRDEGSNE